jgi:hypothetical protein
VHGDLLARVSGRVAAAREEAAAAAAAAAADIMAGGSGSGGGGSGSGGGGGAASPPTRNGSSGPRDARSSIGTSAFFAAAASASGASASHAAAAVHCGFRRDSLPDRILLVSFLLHCADLCNPLFPPPMSRRIAYELEAEFSKQADLERQAGLPVSVMLAHSDVAKAQNEVGFILAVVKPLYTTLAELCPPLRLCCGLIDANTAQWQEVIARAAAPAAA